VAADGDPRTVSDDVNVKLNLVPEAALPLATDGAAGAAQAWALTDLANALLGTGIDWSPRDNAGLMLLACAEEAGGGRDLAQAV
jgi:hypothetical protein